MSIQRFFTPPATKKDWWSSLFAALELTATSPNTVHPPFAFQLLPDFAARGANSAAETGSNTAEETGGVTEDDQALASSRCCRTA